MVAALIGVGVFLTGQLTLVLIWGAQMEMRMRAVESNVKTLTDMRDAVADHESRQSLHPPHSRRS